MAFHQGQVIQHQPRQPGSLECTSIFLIAEAAARFKIDEGRLDCINCGAKLGHYCEAGTGCRCVRWPVGRGSN